MCGAIRVSYLHSPYTSSRRNVWAQGQLCCFCRSLKQVEVQRSVLEQKVTENISQWGSALWFVLYSTGGPFQLHNQRHVPTSLPRERNALAQARGETHLLLHGQRGRHRDVCSEHGTQSFKWGAARRRVTLLMDPYVYDSIPIAEVMWPSSFE